MTGTPLGNRDLIRAINRSIVLNTIKTEGTIARAELARHTGLSPATVTAITAELIEDGLVFEKAPGDSSGGRRPILLALNPHGGYVVGVKLTEEQAIGALTDLEATVLVRASASLVDRTPETAVEVIAGLVDLLLQRGEVEPRKLLGVGLGLAGIVDNARGVLRRSPFFNWPETPLGDLLQQRLGVPAYMDNDVNTLTMAEKWFGKGQGVDDFLTITIGRGVGLGIVVGGHFYRGAGGGAGEFGHTVAAPIDALDAPLCECGKRGCLEAYVGDHGLLRQAAEAYRTGFLETPVNTIGELLTLARAGDPVARQIYAGAGRLLGRAIANLVNLFNPRLIILGGEGIQAGDLLFKTMHAEIQSEGMPLLVEDVSIQIEAWGDDAWARGAASLVLRELFESPFHRKTPEAVLSTNG